MDLEKNRRRTSYYVCAEVLTCPGITVVCLDARSAQTKSRNEAGIQIDATYVFHLINEYGADSSPGFRSAATL